MFTKISLSVLLITLTQTARAGGSCGAFIPKSTSAPAGTSGSWGNIPPSLKENAPLLGDIQITPASRSGSCGAFIPKSTPALASRSGSCG